jgi:hypothetical protein
LFKKIVPLNAERHANKRIRKAQSFAFAAGETLVPLTAQEFPRAAAHFPIVFLKGPKGEVGAFAMLGVPKGENLYVDSDGRWRGGYVPAAIRRYPFVFAKNPSGGERSVALCIDEGSDLLSDTEGEKIFQAKGKPSETVAQVLKFLVEFEKQQMQTLLLCKALEEKKLFHPIKPRVRTAAGKSYAFENLLGIDEKKLNETSDAEFLEWRKRGWLPVIYAHLASLGQLGHLIERHEERAGLRPRAAKSGNGPKSPILVN